MMQTTDGTAPSLLTPAPSVAGVAPAGSGVEPSSQPMSPPITLTDRLKVVGLAAIAGCVGVGVVLLGRGLWHPDAEEPFLPMSPEASTSDAQPMPLRDRLRVVTPSPTSLSPPESIALSPKETARPAQKPRSSPNLSISHGFQPGAAPASAPTSAAPGASAAGGANQGQAIAEATAGSPSPLPLAVIAVLLKPAEPMGAIASSPTPSRPGAVAIAPPLSPLPPTATPPRFSRPRTPLAPPIAPPASRPATPDQPGAVRPAPATPAPGTATPATPALNTPSPPTTPNTADQPRQPENPAIAPPTPAAPVAVAQPPIAEDGIYVDRLNVTGSTRFSQRELAAAIQKIIAPSTAPAPPSSDPTLIQRRLTPAELVQASEAITKLYTDGGYINSGAYVPADVLNGATPEIRVVEGSLETINVQVQPPKFLGIGRPLASRYVQRRLARGIRTPLQIDQLADIVKLLEQDPLIDSISTELAPGTSTGRSVLNVKVRQANPVRASVSVDNGRAPSVGRLRQQVSVSQANLLGLGDRLQLGYNRSEGSNGWDVGYSLPINPSNGTLSFNYSSNRGEVIEEPFRELGIKSRSQTYEIALRQPLKQTSTEEFSLTLRGTHYSSKGVFLEAFNDGDPIPFPARGSDADGRTRVTALRFGQEWLKRSSRDVISLQSEFSLGLNALGATILDEAPDGRFFSWQGRGFWVHSFAPDTLFAFKTQLQFADRPLVPVEQLSIGGIDTVRGYRTSTLLADSGWFASAEAYLPVLRVPKWRGVLQVVPFFDIGQGWNRGEDQPKPDRLMTAGVGLQWKMGDNFRARLDWGVPLINATTETGRSLRESLFFSIVFTP